MSIIDLARLVVYRFHEKGFEIFLINSELQQDPNVWKLPKLDLIKLADLKKSGDYIEIEVEGEKIIAIEGDYHNIPSIRGLIKHDIRVVKSLVKDAVPGIEKGAFVAFKESFKTLLPHQYKAIKELKEVLIESNSIRNI